MATGLDSWVSKLTRQSLPILGDVIVELNKITGSEESDVNQLAEVIMRDPKMTSHVLRVANSVRYNYTNTPVNTISRAIVMIGLKGMRALCISLMVMDNILGEKPKERVLQLMAQSFHAANQARNLMLVHGEADAEEVFVAALMFNLGELAFWASEDVDANNENLMSEDLGLRKAAMEEVLGTSFKSITRGLSKHWKLGDTLEQSLFPGKTPSQKVKAVITGERISRAALYGWDSPQIKKVLSEVQSFCGKDPDESLELLKMGADQAAASAADYGVPDVCPLIPTSLKRAADIGSKPQDKVLQGDPMVQLNVLRELSSATHEKCDVNTIFQMVLEGMHRGIGLERVCIALIKGHKVVAKYVLGENTDHWRRAFTFDVGPYSESIFTHVLETGNATWFDQDFIEHNSDYFPDDIVRVIGKWPSYVSPLFVDERRVGCFYADRFNYGGTLDQEKFESFKHFAHQAQVNLTMASARRKQSY